MEGTGAAAKTKCYSSGRGSGDGGDWERKRVKKRHDSTERKIVVDSCKKKKKKKEKEKTVFTGKREGKEKDVFKDYNI